MRKQKNGSIKFAPAHFKVEDAHKLKARKADGPKPPLVQVQPPTPGGRSWVYPIGTGGVNRRPVYT